MAPGGAGKDIEIIGSMQGFTLVEVIVTLVLASILGAILVSPLDKGLSRSVQPITWTHDHCLMTQVLERVTAVHKKQMDANGDNALSNLKTLIETGSLVDLARYTVQTKYIAFDGGNAEKTATEGDSILKVTITRKSDGQKAVMLYTR
jgi:prepilin-type N-terminal cleavage/methylation domain-containing protein